MLRPQESPKEIVILYLFHKIPLQTLLYGIIFCLNQKLTYANTKKL